MSAKRKNQTHETTGQMSSDEDDGEYEPNLTCTRQYKKQNAIYNDQQPLLNIDHQKGKDDCLFRQVNLISPLMLDRLPLRIDVLVNK